MDLVPAIGMLVVLGAVILIVACVNASRVAREPRPSRRGRDRAAPVDRRRPGDASSDSY